MEIALNKVKGRGKMSIANENEQAKYFERAIQTLLKEEVALCREVLGNLSQQEHVLLTGDINLSEKLKNDYISLIKQQMRFSDEKARINNTKYSQFTSNNIQIRLLTEELIALNDKIQKQFSLNEHLLNLIKFEKPLSQAQKYSVTSKKNQLITLDYPEEKG